MNETIRHFVQVLFLKLRRLHEVPHVIRLGLLKIFPLSETRSFGLGSNLLRDFRPAEESPPEVSQKVREPFLSHLRIRYVKRHWPNMVNQCVSRSSLD